MLAMRFGVSQHSDFIRDVLDRNNVTLESSLRHLCCLGYISEQEDKERVWKMIDGYLWNITVSLLTLYIEL
jgi:hypothetical protein